MFSLHTFILTFNNLSNRVSFWTCKAIHKEYKKKKLEKLVFFCVSFFWKIWILLWRNLKIVFLGSHLPPAWKEFQKLWDWTHITLWVELKKSSRFLSFFAPSFQQQQKISFCYKKKTTLIHITSSISIFYLRCIFKLCEIREDFFFHSLSLLLLFLPLAVFQTSFFFLSIKRNSKKKLKFFLTLAFVSSNSLSSFLYSLFFLISFFSLFYFIISNTSKRLTFKKCFFNDS